MTGPQDPAVAGGDRLRAGHADREQAIETLKTAFVHGRLTKDELDTRAGQALSARTRADLAALTADIPAAPAVPAVPAAAGAEGSPTPGRRWPLATAAVKSGGCLVIAAAALLIGGALDPGGPGPNPGHSWTSLLLFIALAAVVAAFGCLGQGVITSVEQRHCRRRRPPRPGRPGRALNGGRPGGTGHDPVPPGSRTGQTRADLRAHGSRRHILARAGRAPRGMRPVTGT